jgi:hypothetical protein
MADTQRTLAALQTLLADNTAGDISAQDLRDFLVTVHPGAWTKNDTAKTASFTLAAFDDVHVDLATGTPTNVVATLPASPSYLDKVRVTISTDDITPSGGGTPNKLTWSLNSSNLMGGTDDDPYWLFKEGECLELTYYGGDVGWAVTYDGRMSQVCAISDETTGNVTNAEATLPHNTIQTDDFEMAEIGSSRIRINRPNDYVVSWFLGLNQPGTGVRVITRPTFDVGAGATSQFPFMTTHTAIAAKNITCGGDWVYALGEGDYVLQYARTDNATVATLADESAPRLVVRELI